MRKDNPLLRDGLAPDMTVCLEMKSWVSSQKERLCGRQYTSLFSTLAVHTNSAAEPAWSAECNKQNSNDLAE
jgi:hypothetical protein